LPGLIRDGYVIDACAIIDLWHRYPPKTFTSLWKQIEGLIHEGRLVCPGQVLSELRRKDDDACDWLERRRAAMVTKEDATIWNVAQRIVVGDPGLVDHARTRPQADPFVIALAKSLGWSVVTSERTKGFGAVNIQSVCKKQSVACLDLTEFFAEEGWQL
jgi:Domain of unknown function (DUF4411)